MTVTEARQTPNSYDGGTLGLHLGVLRRLALFALTAPPRSIRPYADR
jgi:hypothetical protein